MSETPDGYGDGLGSRLDDLTFTTGRRIPDRALFAVDTLEARVVRAEAEARELRKRTHHLECALSAVDQALTDERVPRDFTEAILTRAGRIRYLGDRCRYAERRFEQVRREVKRLREEFTAPKGRPVQPDGLAQAGVTGQMTVDDCIAEVERD